MVRGLHVCANYSITPHAARAVLFSPRRPVMSQATPTRRQYHATLAVIWKMAADEAYPIPPADRWESAADMLFALQLQYLECNAERAQECDLLKSVAILRAKTYRNRRIAA
jgi:hypothetical protein